MAINILVVDDSAVMRSMIKKTIINSGVEVEQIHEASNGQEGLDVLDREWLDILFIDVNMPVMDGMTFIEFVRQAENGKDIPIMIYSTELDKKLKEDAKKLGVNAWVSKPLDQSKILTAIKGLLEKKSKS